jgi:hypothetical protein
MPAGFLKQANLPLGRVIYHPATVSRRGQGSVHLFPSNDLNGHCLDVAAVGWPSVRLRDRFPFPHWLA